MSSVAGGYCSAVPAGVQFGFGVNGIPTVSGILGVVVIGVEGFGACIELHRRYGCNFVVALIGDCGGAETGYVNVLCCGEEQTVSIAASLGEVTRFPYAISEGQTNDCGADLAKVGECADDNLSAVTSMDVTITINGIVFLYDGVALIAEEFKCFHEVRFCCYARFCYGREYSWHNFFSGPFV